jgi:DNA polymerase III epsilon subunit-like protein
MKSPADDVYISVDVETAGPNPGQYSLLSIGACLVFEPAKTFYVELQPVNDAFTSEALQISGLKMETLKANGLPPGQAMRQFSDWVLQTTPTGQAPIFVALNAPFDWMFITDYFHRYLGKNPFGHKALDIKAFYMGRNDTQWNDTGFEAITKHYQMEQSLNHNALQDAIAQAKLFSRMLEEQESLAKT